MSMHIRMSTIICLIIGVWALNASAEVILLPREGSVCIRHEAGSIGGYPVFHEWRPSATKDSVGAGWVSSLDVSLAKEKALSVVTVEIAGRRFIFQEKSPGRFTAIVPNTGRLESVDDGYRFTMSNGIVLFFSANGRLNFILSRNGETTSVFTDSRGRLKSWVTEKGEGGVIRRNKDGTVSAIRSPSGLTYYQYDNDHLVRITNQQEETWSYDYDKDGRPVRVEEPGRTWEVAYDDAGRIKAIRDSDGESQAIDYAQRGDAQLVYVWCSTGRLVKYICGPDSMLIEEGPMNRGPVRITHIDQRTGQKTIRNRDGTSLVLSPSSRGKFVAMAHRPGTLPVSSVIGPDGRILESRLGDVVFSNITVSPGSSKPRPGTVRDGAIRDKDGRILKLISSGNEIARYAYNQDGRLSQVLLPAGASMSFKYTDDGRIAEYIDAYGAVTRWEYDDEEGIAKQILPNGESEIKRYEPHNRLIAHEGPLGRTIRYGYDKGGRLFGVRQENFDIQFWDPHVNRKTRTYESLLFGNWTFRDLADGWVKMRVDPVGSVILFDLNDAGGVDSVKRLNQKALAAYEYDDAGNLVRARTDSVVLRMEHDKYGRLVSSRDESADIAIELAYNSFGAVSRLRDSDGHTIDYILDKSRKLSEIRSSLAGVFKLSYGVFGLPVRLIRPNGVETRWDYDRGGRVVSCRHILPAGNELFIRYRYDQMGNVIKEVSSASGVTRLTYDALSQLAGFYSPRRGDVKVSYDPWGNLLQYGGRLFKYSQPGILQKAGGAVVECDPAGRIQRIQDAGKTYAFEYDWDHRLERVSGPKTGQRQWHYGPFGRPVIFAYGKNLKKRYAYALKMLYSVKTEGSEKARRYVMMPDLGECLAVIRKDGRIEYPLSDPMRTITHLTDSRGRITASRAFDVLGMPERRDKLEIDLGFAGGLSFLDGKVLYLNDQMYWTSLARALAAPPIWPGSTGLREDNPLSFLSANPFTAVR